MQEAAIQGFRLSPQQKRLWALQRHGRDLPFRAQFAISIEGDLDCDTLIAALNDLIERHEILRTSLSRLVDPANPTQVINEAAEPPLERIDLSAGRAEDRRARIEALLAEARSAAFDPERAALQRAALLKLSPSAHALLLTLPAFYADAATGENLARELALSYGSLLSGEPIPEAPLQYADISEWQNELLEAEETEAGRQYWKKLDLSALIQPPLPGVMPVPAGSEFAPELYSVTVDSNLASKVGALASDRAARSALALACWQVLLSRLSGEYASTVGVAYDGRRSPELEDSLGLFVRHLPVSCPLDPRAPFGKAVEAVSEKVELAVKWQEYFNWGDGDDQAARFFDVCYEYLKPGEPHRAGDATFRVFEQYACAERFRIKLCCVDGGDSFRLDFQYDPSAIRREDVKRLAGYFHNLLKSAVEDPDCPAGRLRFMESEERQQILAGWNDTTVEYDQIDCVHQLFERQARSTPHNIALSFGNNHLTYRELDRRANQLARYLIKLGVGPESRVGICLRATEWMMVAVLGVLKAGGAYVPLDRRYPMERLALMVEEAEVRVIISESELIEELPSVWVEMISVDEQREEIEEESGEGVSSGVRGEGVAYVIYTSGSTGRPKGVMVEHRGVVNYLRYTSREYDVGEGSGSPVHSPLGFDLTITSLLTPLVAGQTVILLEDERGVEGLCSLLREKRELSLIKLTPSHLEMVTKLMGEGELEGGVRALIIGGEALAGETIAPWQVRSPRTRLINEYGPTETVVGCSVFEVPDGENAPGGVPIGKPIANTRMYVLDEYLEPVPVGVTGEIYVAGVGLARGYLRQPHETADKFMPDPFGPEPGGRMYRTGDLAAYRRDGNLEYAGRSDSQVKIRGYRIETGEIEAALRQQQEVGEAVVVAREDAPQDKRLVAYLILNDGSKIETGELRDKLKQRLPHYMVPAAFVVLDRMPLTGNGKVDRRALPPPRPDRARSEAGLVAPRTPVEKKLLEIWSDVLGIESMGINDDFFELGGHSLLATQVVSRVREALEVEVPLNWFFSGTPTIAALAEAIEQQRIAQADPEEIAALLEQLGSLSDNHVKALLASRGLSIEELKIE